MSNKQYYNNDDDNSVNNIVTMAKHARYSTDDVLNAVFDDECLWDGTEELDDPYEPMTANSDDEIGYEDGDDIDEESDEDDDDDGMSYNDDDDENSNGKLDDDIEVQVQYECNDSNNDESENESENESIDMMLPTSWTTELAPIIIEPFTELYGPAVPVPESPLDGFQLFFTDELLQTITDESNRYRQQVLGNEQTQISLDDVKAFLGFTILMGIVVLPSREDYWKKDIRLHYGPIAERISRDRFRELSRYLHFTNNETLVPRNSPSYDRLGKIRPVITYLAQRFSDIYKPGREVAVDEAMIKFQGRSSLKQYLPMKPVKRGIKIWVLADSNNGYFWKFDVYTGKTGENPEKGLGATVVKKLTNELKNKKYHVYFDNFFTSVSLLEDLVKDKIYACGTVRANRKGFPNELKKLQLPKR